MEHARTHALASARRRDRHLGSHLEAETPIAHSVSPACRRLEPALPRAPYNMGYTASGEKLDRREEDLARIKRVRDDLPRAVDSRGHPRFMVGDGLLLGQAARRIPRPRSEAPPSMSLEGALELQGPDAFGWPVEPERPCEPAHLTGRADDTFDEDFVHSLLPPVSEANLSKLQLPREPVRALVGECDIDEVVEIDQPPFLGEFSIQALTEPGLSRAGTARDDNQPNLWGDSQHRRGSRERRIT